MCCILGELKELSLALLLVMATGSDILNRNTLLEHVLAKSSLFSTLSSQCHHRYAAPLILHCLSHAARSDASSTSRDISRDTIALLGLLGNYRKSEAVNPYLTQLRSLSSPAAVHGFAETILSYTQDILMYALFAHGALLTHFVAHLTATTRPAASCRSSCRRRSCRASRATLAAGLPLLLRQTRARSRSQSTPRRTT